VDATSLAPFIDLEPDLLERRRLLPGASLSIIDAAGDNLMSAIACLLVAIVVDACLMPAIVVDACLLPLLLLACCWSC
jgi:hypothetical protein